MEDYKDWNTVNKSKKNKVSNIKHKRKNKSNKKHKTSHKTKTNQQNKNVSPFIQFNKFYNKIIIQNKICKCFIINLIKDSKFCWICSKYMCLDCYKQHHC